MKNWFLESWLLLRSDINAIIKYVLLYYIMCTFSYIQRDACSYVMDICVLDSIYLLYILQLCILLTMFQNWLYILVHEPVHN